MNNIPLSDACLSEVLTRVSFRVIHWYCSPSDVDPLDPTGALRDCAKWLDAEGFEMLAVWVRVYAREWSPMTPTFYLREDLIRRSRTGRTWRHAVYPQYKAGR